MWMCQMIRERDAVLLNRRVRNVCVELCEKEDSFLNVV